MILGWLEDNSIFSILLYSQTLELRRPSEYWAGPVVYRMQGEGEVLRSRQGEKSR